MKNLQCITALSMAVLSVIGCANPSQGRDWRLYDTRTAYRSSSVGFTTDIEKGRREIVDSLGCLVIYCIVDARDNVDTWRVYEAEDWKISELGVRSSSRFLITDPPGQPYVGATDKAHPGEVPADTRLPVGLLPEELDPSTYPIEVEWRIVTGPAREWVADADALEVVHAGKKTINEFSQHKFQVHLCDIELRKMMEIPADEFGVMFRVAPVNWPGGTRSAVPRIFFLRERITQDRIKKALEMSSRSADPATSALPVDPSESVNGTRGSTVPATPSKP